MSISGEHNSKYGFVNGGGEDPYLRSMRLTARKDHAWQGDGHRGLSREELSNVYLAYKETGNLHELDDNGDGRITREEMNQRKEEVGNKDDVIIQWIAQQEAKEAEAANNASDNGIPPADDGIETPPTDGSDHSDIGKEKNLNSRYQKFHEAIIMMSLLQTILSYFGFSNNSTGYNNNYFIDSINHNYPGQDQLHEFEPFSSSGGSSW